MGLAAKFKLNVSQLDVTTAYLNGKIDTEIYMEKPEFLEEMLKRIYRIYILCNDRCVDWTLHVPRILYIFYKMQELPYY